MPGRTDGAPRSVAYLGPAGTFSEEALLGSARPGSVEPVAVASIREAVDALEAGSVELAIVPIENSLEGSINVTLDLLAEQAGEVRIVGETLLRVRHCLIAARAVPLEGIESVVSHPQVPRPCARWWPPATTRWPRSAPSSLLRSTARSSCVPVSRTARTTKHASCGWR